MHLFSYMSFKYSHAAFPKHTNNLLFQRIITLVVSIFVLINTNTAVANCSLSSIKTIKSILNGEHRAEEHKERDQFRNPLETLEFLGINKNMTVVEIWPGAKGWYTEILAPLLKTDGQLIAAHFPKDSKIGFFRNSRKTFEKKIELDPTPYQNIKIIDFNPPNYASLASPNSVDMVLTFRNVHNWIKAEKDNLFYEAFYNALKPGGILGIIEHRGNEPMNTKQMAISGYVPEKYVIARAKGAGFKLVSRAEINANPKDLKMHPEGVWSLPPTLRGGAKDKYMKIGESDRMTLKFIKPKL